LLLLADENLINTTHRLVGEHPGSAVRSPTTPFLHPRRFAPALRKFTR
jgi:hypothetical protein